MQISGLYEMYLAELQELCSTEAQLGRALEGAADAASSPELKGALVRHRHEAALQEKRLEALLQSHEENGAHTDQAMEAMLRETVKMTAILRRNAVRDVGLIVSMQKIGHYKIAAYGSLAALAGQLGLESDQTILQQSLAEEQHSDAALTELAESEINPTALAA